MGNRGRIIILDIDNFHSLSLKKNLFYPNILTNRTFSVILESYASKTIHTQVRSYAYSYTPDQSRGHVVR